MEYKLILASASPRRHQLMCDAGFKFEVRLKHTEEIWPEGLAVEEVPEYLAGLKAKAFDGEHAIEMLHRLSGRKHQVVTGVCLTTLQEHRSFSAYTDVYFKTLSDQEITCYVDTYKPFDKAGAYGIQEWIGYVAVEAINGSFYNVMGLPVRLLYQELKKF